ncbi:hypothetical protein [Kordia sp.]|uniref:hypothetical protein n=1 Tax=Kordia sp. TaxID=1965332 RepID=UPI003D2E2321
MIHTFLKAKHWQLFIILLGLPLLFQFYIMYTMFSTFGTETNPDPENFIDFFQIFPLIMIVFMSIFFGWFWSIAIGLQHCIPSTIKMNVTKFKVFFFIPLAYITFIMLHMAGIIATSQEGFEWIYALIIPLHLFSMFCIFHTLYFVSKTIKTAEVQRKVEFSEFLGEFFLLWFYFIGIWIIQPKVNKLYEKLNDNSSYS